MSPQPKLRHRAPLAVGVAAAVAALAGPATASAATLDVSADFKQLTYTAAPGENNSLLVREGDDDRGKTISFKDSVPIEIVGLGRSTCFPVTGDPAFVTCYPIHGAFTRLTTSLGNGVNQLTSQSGSVPMFASGAGAISNTFDGGPGQDFLSGGSDEDQLQGGSGNDILDGQGGDDSLNAGSGTDELHGGADDDQLRGGLDADLLNGGTGVDHATYSERTTPLLVSLDGLANDGQLTPREGDNVLTNVEQVTGGSERDFLIGNDAPNRLVGGAGNDVITGGLGVDTMQGGIGNDTLRSKDGLQELVDCGADVDQVDADVIDLKPTCEGSAAPAVGIGPERVQLDARGRARLTLHCWATARKLCTGTLTLRHGTQPAGKKRFTIHSGHTTAVRVRLASTVQRKLDRKAVALDAMTKSRDGSGRKWTSRNTVTLVSR